MTLFWLFLELFFDQLFDHFLDHFWEPFWGPLWDQIGQRGGKMSPREPSGASKSQKTAFSKTFKRCMFFNVFGSRGLPRELQEAQEGSQEAPKELQNLKKRDPKMDPKINNFLTNFGPILGSILGPKTAPKRDQKWVHFWNAFPAALRGPGVAFSGNKREWWKGYWSWNYTLQKKGRDKGIRPYKAS